MSQPHTHRAISTRPTASAPHLARWKYADASGRIVYRDAQVAESEGLRLIRPPEGSVAAPKVERTVTLEEKE